MDILFKNKWVLQLKNKKVAKEASSDPYSSEKVKRKSMQDYWGVNQIELY